MQVKYIIIVSLLYRLDLCEEEVRRLISQLQIDLPDRGMAGESGSPGGGKSHAPPLGCVAHSFAFSPIRVSYSRHRSEEDEQLEGSCELKTLMPKKVVVLDFVPEILCPYV